MLGTLKSPLPLLLPSRATARLSLSATSMGEERQPPIIGSIFGYGAESNCYAAWANAGKYLRLVILQIGLITMMPVMR